MIPRWLFLVFITSLLCRWNCPLVSSFHLPSVTSTRGAPTILFLTREERQGIGHEKIFGLGRSCFLHTVVFSIFATSSAVAFEGGVGGLGKTKPNTGVVLFEASSTPIQNEKGIVSAEIQSVSGKPILVEFQTPWPLLPTTSGLEARNLRSSESAFIQLVPTVSDWQNRKVFEQLLLNSVLASQGKYGAYGTPTDVRVKPLNGKGVYAVTLTCYTPAMRESERQLLIRPIQVDDSIVMLVTGTTRNAFSTQESKFSQIADSFIAVAAPESRLRTK